VSLKKLLLLGELKVLVASDGRHKPRTASDFSQTINRFTQLDAYPLPRMEDQVAELSKSKYFFTLDLKCAYYQVSISPEGKKYTGFETLGKLLSIHPRAIRSNEWSVGFSKNIINTVIQKHGLRHTYAYLDNIAVGGATVEERVKNIAAFLKSRKKKIVHLTKKRSANRATEIDLLGYRLSFGSIRPDPNRLKPLIELKSNPHKLKRTMDMSGFLRSNKSI